MHEQQKRPYSCSPHTRGWTAVRAGLNDQRVLFPAHAGMDRVILPAERSCRTCSPHTRGWTEDSESSKTPSLLFPAHAGMDLVRSGRG